MLTFKITSDPHALDIYHGLINVGSLQWHEEREPRVVLHTTSVVSLTFLEIILRRLKEEVKKEKLNSLDWPEVGDRIQVTMEGKHLNNRMGTVIEVKHHKPIFPIIVQLDCKKEKYGFNLGEFRRV